MDDAVRAEVVNHREIHGNGQISMNFHSALGNPRKDIRPGPNPGLHLHQPRTFLPIDQRGSRSSCAPSPLIQ